jgi:cysteine desulfuration protein SufE
MGRRECPTVRGHTRILDEGLNGATTQEILEVSSDIYLHMGLQTAVSPLRLRGIGGRRWRVETPGRRTATGSGSEVS